ncbi:LysR family transcriptional regulator [Faecalispora anaeroviscerum]|uniref:LysR family transcriptional regulator n=1 Tax=Faecalispora anaeroviscerum TaxID=2991836 RepID=UPI0024B881FA|nr:LysR family transcriptional regulator [Faecalispora anaeroviscerum]
MEIKYLKYFQAVADYGSINQAAKVMYVSQPHLSHIIKEVEEEAGFELFQRTKQGCVLTKNGEKYLKHCEVILREIENLKQFSSEIQDGESMMSVSMTKFSHTAECFNRICCRHWNLERYSYRLNEDSTMNVVDDVISGSANVGVIHFASQEEETMQKLFSDKELHFRRLATFLPYVCLSSGHELLNGSQGIDVSELKNYGFVRYIGQFEDFIYHITEENLHLDLNDSSRIVYVNDRAEQMNLISTGDFFTIGISEFSGQNSLYGVVSVPLMNCSEHIQFGIVTKRDRKLADAEREFIDEVTESYRELQMRENQTVRSGLAAD